MLIHSGVVAPSAFAEASVKRYIKPKNSDVHTIQKMTMVAVRPNFNALIFKSLNPIERDNTINPTEATPKVLNIKKLASLKPNLPPQFSYSSVCP